MKATTLTRDEFNKKITNLDARPFQWEFLGDKPAVIDFYASWCGPCKMMAPVMDELAEEYEGRVDIYKINIEEEEEIASAFGVRSVPSFVFVPMDGEPKMSVGAASKGDMEKIIDGII